MSERNYYIYKVMRNNEEENVFFRPKSSNRIASLLAYKMCGYEIIACLKVNEEDWHNAKLREFCKEYCDLDKEEHQLHTQYVKGDYPHSEDCLVETLTLMQDRKWTLLKMIHRYVRIMVNKDLDIREELAVLLNDQYVQAIL